MAGLAVLAVVLLTPLKHTDVVPVLVDRSTGEAQVETRLMGVSISQQEAVRKADLAAYVIARESFDRDLLRRYYETVRERSTQAVFKPYAAQFDRAAPDSVFKKYPGASQRSIEVRSVVLLGPSLGQVHYTATLTQPTQVKHEDFIATLGFRYDAGPLGFRQRLRNPLGFVVTSYRVDQESLPKEGQP